VIRLIDAKEEIIKSLVLSIRETPELDILNEDDIRNIIAVLINTQFDNDLKRTQNQTKAVIENILFRLMERSS
jgi:hypothetical protein